MFFDRKKRVRKKGVARIKRKRRRNCEKDRNAQEEDGK